MNSRSDTVRKKWQVEILEHTKKTGCQDVRKMSFVLTGNDDAGVGTLDHAVCCYGKVAQSFSIGVVVKKVTVGPIQLECCIWIMWL